MVIKKLDEFDVFVTSHNLSSFYFVHFVMFTGLAVKGKMKLKSEFYFIFWWLLFFSSSS